MFHQRQGRIDHFRHADLQEAEGGAASFFQARFTGPFFVESGGVLGLMRAAEMRVSRGVEPDEGAPERGGEVDRAGVIADEQVDVFQKGSKAAEREMGIPQMSSRNLRSNFFHESFF